MKKWILCLLLFLSCNFIYAQNVGINIPNPAGKLHIKGGSDVSQLIIDAHSPQSNTSPLMKLRNSLGNDLLWIHSDDPSNTFMGLNSGRVNNISGGGEANTFIGRDAGYANTSGAHNTATGYNALLSNTIGEYNAAIGNYSLYANTSGANNTATGPYSLYSNTTGNSNTANGFGALYSNVAGSNATAIGYNAMQYANNTVTSFTNYGVAVGYEALRGSFNASANTGNHNTAMGYQTLRNNTTGSFNTAEGYNALYSNTTGANNTADGNAALQNNTTGFSNVAIGTKALYTNTTRNNMVAIGDSALYNNGLGAYDSYQALQNTAVGSKALFGNTIGWGNTASGWRALYSNTTGFFNTAYGAQALFSSTASQNTAIGYKALLNNTTGNGNTASGANALSSNTTGQNNTASGNQALYYNTTGDHNTSNGSYALEYNTTGYSNTANGYQALHFNSTGHHNTAIGREALFFNNSFANTGVGWKTLFNSIGTSGNTALGYLAGNSQDNSWDNTFIGNGADANGIFNTSMALGAFTYVSASQQVRIGFNTTSIGGPVAWTNTSDRRIKNNIQEDVHGLDFILLLRPVTYTKSLQQEMEIMGITSDRPLAADNPYEKIRYSGFIAQEVEQAAQRIAYDFSGVDAPKNDKGLYGLRYAEFVVPLVKAVQELSAENAQFKNELEELKILVNALIDKQNVQAKAEAEAKE